MSYKTREEAVAACEMIKANIDAADYQVIKKFDEWEIHVRLHGAVRQVHVKVNVLQEE